MIAEKSFKNFSDPDESVKTSGMREATLVATASEALPSWRHYQTRSGTAVPATILHDARPCALRDA
ncbi:MAG: hypothetical protein WA183_12025 [Chthoniobacterales bacterium]